MEVPRKKPKQRIKDSKILSPCNDLQCMPEELVGPFKDGSQVLVGQIW